MGTSDLATTTNSPKIEIFTLDSLRIAGILPTDFLDNDVYDITGVRLGRVTDVIVDQSATYILAFEVVLEKNIMRLLGLKKLLGSTRVAFVVSMVKGIGDVITIKYTMIELGELLRLGVPELKNVHRVSEGGVSF